MKKIFTLSLILSSLWSFSQISVNGPSAGSINPTIYSIVGQVVEASSNQSIDYATITVMDLKTDELISGTTTEGGGVFRLETKTKEVYIEVSFIGYSTKRVEEFNWNGNKADLGVIKLGEDTKTLDEVVVTATKSTTEFKLDKRVFNVGTDLSTTGASALEVLNNVPSVNVNIEGEVTLRGSGGVQILINGKPSVLTDEAGGALGTITADMLESVEVITNPSAKYEAEGTSGIINLVLKKNEKNGLNGSLTLNTGWPHNHSVGLSLNKRTQKLNLFTQFGVGYKVQPNEVENINRDLVTGRTINSDGEEFRNENFYNIILGSDYYINPQNIITLSGSFAYEIEDQPSTTNFTSFDGNELLTREWQRTEVTEATNPKLQYELQYKRDFTDHKDHQLQFSAIGNYFGKDQSSIFNERTISGPDNPTNQTTATAFDEGKYTFNLDYTKPIAEQWQIETGAQYVDNSVSNDFTVSDIIDGETIINEGLTNIFEYDQKVLGVYTTGSYEGDLWGVKLGLRAENTDLSTLLKNTNEENSQNFTNLFPSAHTSYKLSERVSLQAGYSRRIYRPRLWDLNPFFNIRNNFSIRAGNPNLLPEYTDSYEVGSIFIYEQISFNVNAYHRYTTEKIERVSTFSDNVNIFSPENIGTNRTTGLELNFKYSPMKKVTINGDGNYNIFRRKGEFNDQVFDFNADQWSTKITSKFKFSRSFDFEVTGQYQSSEQTIQGTRSANLFGDLGMRYKILNGKAVVNLSVRDIFASRIRENIAEGADFSAYSFRQRGRFISLGFSYGFGKGEAMTYGGGRRR
jgi:outer membrane receptor protein involved in Fe transport